MKLLQKDQSLIKSEFFSKDESDAAFKLPGFSPHNFQMSFLNNISSIKPQHDKPGTILKTSDAHNLSTFLKNNHGNLQNSKEIKNEFSMRFKQNSSGIMNSLQLISNSDKSKPQHDFPLMQSFQSKNLNSSKFQSIMPTSGNKDIPIAKITSSQTPSMNSLVKSMKQYPNVSISHSQPPLQNVQVNSSLLTMNQNQVSVKDISMGPMNPSQSNEKLTNPSVIDQDLVNFAILFKLLQKKKKLAEMHDQLVKSTSQSNLETNTEDLRWVKQSVTQIDKTLKNVWLSLKLRDTTITSNFCYFIFFY